VSAIRAHGGRPFLRMDQGHAAATDSAGGEAGAAATLSGAGIGSGAASAGAGRADRRKASTAAATAGDDGMHRWVGLGVIADNLITIGTARTAPSAP
jgi:hypothetical protein